MYDKPNAAELIDAVCQHLQDAIIPLLKDTDRRLYYETLVAINALKITQREAALEMVHLREEWQRLNFIQRASTPFPDTLAAAQMALAERNRRLCEDIAAGVYDYWPRQAALFEHLMVTTHAQLEVTNPDFLKQLVLEGDKDGT
ncbi:MAG: DUF6285 domain-containing protein [Anaerolineae bacterium]|nr:DUF6285 domain-containing protein [Anaerolineae bacterium]